MTFRRDYGYHSTSARAVEDMAFFFGGLMVGIVLTILIFWGTAR